MNVFQTIIRIQLYINTLNCNPVDWLIHVYKQMTSQRIGKRLDKAHLRCRHNESRSNSSMFCVQSCQRLHAQNLTCTHIFSRNHYTNQWHNGGLIESHNSSQRTFVVFWGLSICVNNFNISST